jgi:hypothetical protein
MAWTVDKLFDFVNFLTRKNQTAVITPSEFFLAWNSEQRSKQGELIGVLTKQKKGMLEDQATLSSLAPFTKNSDITIDITGAAPKPSDFSYLLAARVSERKVTMVNKGQIYSVINDLIDPPNITLGIFYGTEYDTFYKIWPSQADTLTIDYIRNPPDVVYGYTEDANGVAVYNAGTSTQPLWKDIELQEITKRTLRLFGVSMSSQEFQNFANQTIQTGS